MQLETYDVCVIGGGPSGFAAAMHALDFNLSVVLVERERLGGAGVFNGALASKTLWELSKDVRRISYNTRGYNAEEITVAFDGILKTMHDAESEREFQMKHQCQVFERELAEGRFKLLQGQAKMASSTSIQVTHADGSTTHINAHHTVLATGTRPRKLPNIPIDEKIIVTSDGIASFENFPESMVILGAGVIGCEFATIFSNFKRTKVYIIDKADRILPFEDQDIADNIAKNLEVYGVTIHHGASLKSMDIVDGKVQYTLTYKDGREETNIVEKALVSVGRVPNVENLGLEEVGVKIDERFGVPCDDTQTSVPNIYAVGDVTGDVCLVNVGELEARHAIKRIMGLNPKPLSYNNISTIMFLEPEVAGVGMNETQCKKENIPYRVACFGYEYIARAICMRNIKGFFKILVTDDDEMKILGMRALGPQASSSIQAVALLISMDKGIRELAELIHPHPSIVEGVQECVRMFLGQSIIKPSVFDRNIRCGRVINGEFTPLC